MMTAYDKLKFVRAGAHPTGGDYLNALITDRVDLGGDRKFGEDKAIISGIGKLGKISVAYAVIDKGHTLEEKMEKNFGCPKPEGYRKALRIFKMAEKFHLPVLCIVDTLGAYCGSDGEERGQGEAIATNLAEMMALKTPIITIITGEGGSGGALALAVADRVYMTENAVFSVITPDGCASILWKDSSRMAEAVECLKVTSSDMLNFGVCEKVFPEDDSLEERCRKISESLTEEFTSLKKLSNNQLLDNRYARFRKFGSYEEKEKFVILGHK